MSLPDVRDAFFHTFPYLTMQTALERLENQHSRALNTLRDCYETYTRIKKLHEEVAEYEVQLRDGAIPEHHKRKFKVTSDKSQELLRDAEKQLKETIKLVEEIVDVKLIVEQVGMYYTPA